MIMPSCLRTFEVVPTFTRLELHQDGPNLLNAFGKWALVLSSAQHPGFTQCLRMYKVEQTEILCACQSLTVNVSKKRFSMCLIVFVCFYSAIPSMSQSQVSALRHLTWQIRSHGSWQQLSKSCDWATSKDHVVPARSKTSTTKETREPHNRNFMTYPPRAFEDFHHFQIQKAALSTFLRNVSPYFHIFSHIFTFNSSSLLHLFCKTDAAALSMLFTFLVFKVSSQRRTTSNNNVCPSDVCMFICSTLDSGLCLVQKCSAARKKYSYAVLQSFERVWAEPRFATSNRARAWIGDSW